MSTNVSQRENAADSEAQTVDSRTERALSECMTVLSDHGLARDAPGLFVVIGENENGEYLVDSRTGSCDCDDMRYRDPDGGCKHLRRVAVLTGDRPIPTWIPDVVDIDTRIGANVDKNVRFVQTDGGVVTNTDSDTGTDADADADDDIWSEPQLEVNKYHEPTGEKYVWCTNCGVEVLVGETENASHGPGCIHREGDR
jgi:hypothetical protein